MIMRWRLDLSGLDEAMQGEEEYGALSDECREAIHRLYHYLDGELDDAKRALIRQHLDECAPCYRAFDFEAELRRLVAEKCREQLPPGLLERIARAIGHEPSGHVGQSHAQMDQRAAVGPGSQGAHRSGYEPGYGTGLPGKAVTDSPPGAGGLVEDAEGPWGGKGREQSSKRGQGGF
jgi:mycothiol system anti-sigma-R factor